MMKNKLMVLLGGLLLLTACQNTPTEMVQTSVEETNEVNFYTSDSLQIFGELYEVDKTGSSILLFHQGGSNARGEYSSIIPKLQEKGFNVLAIDQRRGGQRYGSYNRVVANMHLNRYEYCDALPDLEGALNFMSKAGYTGNKILWGSSYSAALAVQLASSKPDEVSAVLSFSPASGGPMESCNPNLLFESLKTPLLVLRPGNEAKMESVQAQLALAKEHGHQTYVAGNGVHGSSMLVEERIKGSADTTWNVVNTFLEKFK